MKREMVLVLIVIGFFFIILNFFILISNLNTLRLTNALLSLDSNYGSNYIPKELKDQNLTFIFSEIKLFNEENNLMKSGESRILKETYVSTFSIKPFTNKNILCVEYDSLIDVYLSDSYEVRIPDDYVFTRRERNADCFQFITNEQYYHLKLEQKYTINKLNQTIKISLW